MKLKLRTVRGIPRRTVNKARKLFTRSTLTAARGRLTWRALKSLRKPLLIALPLLLATPVAVEGYNAVTWQDPQLVYYNEGVSAYRDAFANQDPVQLDNAITDFQESIAAYQSESQRGGLDRLLHGSPSAEVASLAYLHLAVAQLAEGAQNYDQKEISQAVESFKDAIRVNPGGPYNRGLSAAEVNRLEEESLPAKYDLELLYQQNPQQQQQQQTGNGKGRPGQQQPGQPQPQQAPQQNPSNVPGHGSGQGF